MDQGKIIEGCSLAICVWLTTEKGVEVKREGMKLGEVSNGSGGELAEKTHHWNGISLIPRASLMGGLTQKIFE